MDDNSLGSVVDAIHAEGPAAAVEGAQVDVGAASAATGADAGVAAQDAADAGAEADTGATADTGDEGDGEFELQIDGQTETLTGSQLIELVQQARAGGKAGADVEAVRTEVEQTKQKMFADNASGLEKVGQATINRLNHMQQLVDSLLPQKPDISMLRTDPDSYHELSALYEQFAQVRAKIDAELDAENRKLGAVRGQGEVLSAAQTHQLLQDEKAKLIEALPEMREPEKAQAFLTGAQKLAVDLGFSPEEFAAVTDHRLFKLIKMAMGGQAAPVAKEQQRNAIRRRIADKPPVARSGNGQFTGKSAAAVAAQQRVTERGGRVSDIAALIDAGG